MKKYVFLLVITIFTIMLIGSNTQFDNQDVVVTDTSISIPISSDETLEEDEILYIARNLDGYVAIYVPNENIPYIITDINIQTLPKTDRENLETGIFLDKNYTLANFIEDFSS